MTYVRTLWCITLFCPSSYLFKYCKAFQCGNLVTNNFSSTASNKFSTKLDGPPWRIIYFGTDNFSWTCVQPICAKLRTGTLISDLAIVSGPGSIVRKFAEKEKLTSYDWPLDPNTIKDKYDLGIVVSFGHLIPEKLINALPLGILNVHGSILPRWRGAAPIVYAVMHGDPETGVTIMRIKPKRFDHGDIVRQYRCPIGPHDTAKNLTDKLAKHGAQLLMECIRDLPRCLNSASPQPTEGVTFAPRVNSSLSTVNWTKMDAKTVYNLHRAVSHLYALTAHWHGSQVKLIDVQLDTQIKPNVGHSVNSSPKSALDFLNADKTSGGNVVSDNVIPGRVMWDPKVKKVSIQCADGNYVVCLCLSFVGKRKMTPADFYNGYLSKKKESEWVMT